MSINSVSIAGTGNVALHLGCALRDTGIQIDKVYGRDISKAKQLAEILGAEPVSDIHQLKSDLVLICVKDDAIQEISQQLNADIAVCHTSGSIPMEALNKHGKHGVFYPLQTFSSERNVSIENVPLLIEASDRAFLTDLAELAARISENVQVASSEERKQIHLAAVYVNNFTNHLIDTAKELMDERGLDWKLILPLLKETVAKLEDLDPDEAQTGPAKRNDNKTITEHLSMLPEDEKELYKLISQRISAKFSKQDDQL